MKLTVKPNLLKYLLLGTGVLGLLLRMVLYTTGTDKKGLLVRGHWAGIVLWVLTFAVVAAAVWLTRSVRGPERYRDAFPVSVPAAAGAAIAAAALLFTGVKEITAAGTPLDLALAVLGLAAGAALVGIAFCRLCGAKPVFGLHGLVCVYFALRMVCQYRHWSSDPQLQDYCFYLLAYVGLMLTAYQHAAFDAGMGNHRMVWLLSLITVYLCCVSLSGSRDRLIMLAGGIWVFTNLTALKTKPRRQRPALDLEQGT